MFGDGCFIIRCRNPKYPGEVFSLPVRFSSREQVERVMPDVRRIYQGLEYQLVKYVWVRNIMGWDIDWESRWFL